MNYKCISLVIFIFYIIINLSSSSISEDENRINSEGMWQRESQPQRTPISSGNGNSRFDVGGILTAIGIQKGASILGLVVFPFLFPIVVLFGAALFIISMFGGAAPLVSAGRRFDANGNEISSDINLVTDVFESEECIERIGCEILDKTSRPETKSKILRFLRRFNIYPNSVEKVEIAITNRSGCPVFKCTFHNFISRAWDYAKAST